MRAHHLPPGSETSFVRWCCPLCDGEGEIPYRATHDYNWGIPGEFSYIRCRDCGLVRQNPRPAREHVPSLYPEHYGSAVHGREEVKEVIRGEKLISRTSNCRKAVLNRSD